MKGKNTVVIENPGVPLRSAKSALHKLDACLYVKSHSVTLRAASQWLLRAVLTSVCKRGSNSSPRLNWSSTASVFGPRLIKGEPRANGSGGTTGGIGSANFSLVVYRNTSAGQRWRIEH